MIGNKDCKYVETLSENAYLISTDSVLAKFLNKIYKLCQKIKRDSVCYYRDIAVLNMYSLFFKNNILISGSFYAQKKCGMV